MKPREPNHVRVAGHPLLWRLGVMGRLPLHRSGAQWELKLQEGVAPERGCDAPLPGLEWVRSQVGHRAQGMEANGPAAEGTRRENGGA